MLVKKAHHPAMMALMNERKVAYTTLLGGKEIPNRTLVLEDLSRFCREKMSTFHPDARIAANLDGRREVILRIRDYLELSVDELCSKYAKE